MQKIFDWRLTLLEEKKKPLLKSVFFYSFEVNILSIHPYCRNIPDLDVLWQTIIGFQHTGWQKCKYKFFEKYKSPDIPSLTMHIASFTFRCIFSLTNAPMVKSYFPKQYELCTTFSFIIHSHGRYIIGCHHFLWFSSRFSDRRPKMNILCS